MSSHCIYKIQNKLNGKVYIGQTINFKKRIREHINDSKTVISKAINKYGKDNFSFDIIHNNIDDDCISDWEIYYINEIYNSYKGWGYNCTIGGEKLYGKSNPFYNKEHTKKSKQLMSKKHSGKNSVWYGKKHTDEEKDKIRKSHSKLNKEGYIEIYKDYINSKLSLRKTAKKYNLGLATIGRIVNAKHWATKHLKPINKNLYNSQKGENHPRSKYSNKVYIKIFKEYHNTDKSYSVLADEYNLDKSTIGRIVKGEHTTTKDLEVGD